MKRFVGLLFSFAILLGLVSISQAAFRDMGWGVRANGLGGAFTVLADDSSALFWNPAGTAWTRRGDVSFAGSRAFPGLSGINISYGSLSLIAPSRSGTFGVGATSYNADNLMRENIGLLHYARMLGDAVSVGANFKYLWHGYNVDEAARSNPVFSNGTSKSALTADAGARIKVTDYLAAGLLGRNVTEPNVGLAAVDRVPAEYQAGLLFNPAKVKSLFVELDGSYRHQQSQQDKTDFHLGVENWFFRKQRSSFALRAGLNSYQVAGGFSVNVDSWDLYSLRLDYTYIYNTGISISEAVTHQVGLTLYFTTLSEDAFQATRKPRTNNAASNANWQSKARTSPSYENSASLVPIETSSPAPAVAEAIIEPQPLPAEIPVETMPAVEVQSPPRARRGLTAEATSDASAPIALVSSSEPPRAHRK